MKWFKKKRIIVPFDYSDESMNAVRVGLSLAETKEDVHLVHVLHDLPGGLEDYYWEPAKNVERQAHAKEAIAERLALADIGSIKIDVLVGEPATEIVELAREIEADLIVIPSHGYTGLKKMFLGSVAQGVVRLAQCPVLVLKR